MAEISFQRRLELFADMMRHSVGFVKKICRHSSQCSIDSLVSELLKKKKEG